MARRHIVQKRETLQQLAKKYYGDSSLYRKLALYNGIRDPGLIFVGQTIEVPSMRELEGGIPVTPVSPNHVAPPNGLDQILDTFGNIYEGLREDGTLDAKWEGQHLSRGSLPFPILLSGNPPTLVTKIYCHKKLVEVFSGTFVAIKEEGLADRIKSYGGCFNFRLKRKGGKFSTHCWGIAVDLNVETNQMGSAGDMDSSVVNVFRRFGFKWGGDWSGKSKDPMHFQFCTGY